MRYMKTCQILLIFSFFLQTCTPGKERPLTIAVAANVQFAMQELTEHFTSQTGMACQIVHSSSGKLTAQIMEGAPYDLFISADMKYPEELHRAGLTTSPPLPYAYGKLVLWSLIDDFPSPIDIGQLATRDAVRHIAIANPKTAPYGVAAIEALQYFAAYDALQAKLVFGESISQVNQFVLSKTAEVGITAKSVVLSPKIKGQGKWTEVPPASYSPIAQGVVILKKGQIEKAEQFHSFLFSESARVILEKYGYELAGGTN